MISIDPAAAKRATQAVPSIPCDAEGPVFREPWEAQAFAMALSLHERGLFTWPEWAATLGAEIKQAQAARVTASLLNYGRRISLSVRPHARPCRCARAGFEGAMSLFMALRDISRRRSNSVAFGAKGTSASGLMRF